MQLQNAKYELLNEQQQQEVENFINNLLQKKEAMKAGFDAFKYKKKVLKVSVWSENEISVFEKNNKLFKKWTPTAW
ncbi:MAG: hypothetical protein U0U67_08125 [Chitinophagales bacterium]